MISSNEQRSNMLYNLVSIGGGVMLGFGLGAGIVCLINNKINKKLSPAKKGLIAALSTVGELMCGISEKMY